MTRREKMNDESDCRRCGKSTGMIIANNVTLIGDYHTVLCRDCQNAFHVYIVGHPTFLAQRDAIVRSNILMARTQGDGVDRTEEIASAAQREYRLTDALFDVSKAWVLGSEPTS